MLVVTAPDTPESNLAIVERFQQLSEGRLRVERRPTAGFAAALNHAFRAATADRVGLLFSDDWLDPDAVELCLAVSGDIVSGNKRIWSDDGTNPIHVVWEGVGTEAELNKCESFEAKARYVTHFLLLNWQSVLNAGGVDETLGDRSGVDDYDLLWTLLEGGASVGFTDRAVYNVRDHHGVRLTLRPPEEHLASLVKILTKHGLDEAGSGRSHPDAHALVQPQADRRPGGRRRQALNRAAAGSAPGEELVPLPELLGAALRFVEQPRLQVAEQLGQAAQPLAVE